MNLIPEFDSTPEWQEAITSPYFDMWRKSPYDEERVRGAVACQIIRKLRTSEVRQLILRGDPHWTAIAINVVRSPHRWHQSTRIQVSALRTLRRRLTADGLPQRERQDLHDVISETVLRLLDAGIGEEFRAVAHVARGVSSLKLVSALELRLKTAESRAARINAQRMLEYVQGGPYRRYHDCM